MGVYLEGLLRYRAKLQRRIKQLTRESISQDIVGYWERKLEATQKQIDAEEKGKGNDN